jgi:NAD(P)-dependent dehydrogenase (short-subunit alcohol dehydrogenase family)
VSAAAGRLAGRRAIVTGAGFGIGRAIALKLAGEGCDVGVLDLSDSDAHATCDLIGSLGRRGHAACADVAMREDSRAALERLSAALGGVDILINNAGILRTAPFLETSPETWRQVMSINLDGVFHACQAVLPQMIARRSGVIINMASWTGKKGVPNHSAYATSKFAVIGLTQCIAAEVAPLGVRVNAVCPGIIVDTRMRDEAEALNASQGLPDVATRVQAVPLRRAGTPEDVAGVVAFLASDEASYMTGQALNITGGLWTG